MLNLVSAITLSGMAEGDVSDLFSDVSDISYTSELDDAPVSVKYDLSNGSPLERDKFKVVHFNINSITAESKLTTLIDLCKKMAATEVAV